MNYKLKKKIKGIFYHSEFTKNIYILAGKIKKKKFDQMNDVEFAKCIYKDRTGVDLNLENPRTFDEKLWWLKYYNKDPLLTKCTDKYLVRDYVRECGLSSILTKIYGAWDSVDDINLDNLPNRFFLKTNNGSGCNILCNDKATFDFENAKKILHRGLESNYFYVLREYNYKDIHPKVLCEEVLAPANRAALIDYKIYCFNGKVKLILRAEGTALKDGSHATEFDNYFENYFDENFTPVQLTDGYKQLPFDHIRIPDQFDLMKSYAEVLANPFPFVRVDLYNFDSRIVFGELTFYCGGGIHHYTPKDYNLKLGGLLDLSAIKSIK